MQKGRMTTKNEEEEEETENETGTLYYHYRTINIKTKIIINNPCNGTDYKLYIKVIIAKYAYSFDRERESICLCR